MKKLLFVIFMFVTSFSYGQNYNQIISKLQSFRFENYLIQAKSNNKRLEFIENQNILGFNKYGTKLMINSSILKHDNILFNIIDVIDVVHKKDQIIVKLYCDKIQLKSENYSMVVLSFNNDLSILNYIYIDFELGADLMFLNTSYDYTAN